MCIIIMQSMYCLVNTVLQPLNINIILIADVTIALLSYVMIDYIIKLKANQVVK